MAAIPFALSIHHFISSVGADVGFASIIGLALLVLLFFAQARETASLRRRADEAEEQLHALHLYVDQLSRTPAQGMGVTVSPPVAAPPAAARIAARPLVAPAPSQAVPVAPVPVGAVATIPAAPAGVGAPALSAATRLIPIGEPDPISIRALKSSTNGQAGPDQTAGSETAVATEPPNPPPSTAAAGGNGAGTVGGDPMSPLEGRPANGAVAPPPRVALRPQGPPPARPAPPPLRRAATGGRDPNARGRLTPVALALLVALGLAVVAVGVLVLTSSGASPSRSVSSTAAARTTAATTASRRQRRRRATTATTAAPAAVTPASVTVAVLNGTNTSHLAADVLGKLTGVGYKGGPTANAAETGVSSTIVGYTQPAYRADALAVAKSLNLGPASVQGVSQGDRTAVCGSVSVCPAQVVVTVGSDLSSAG
jgi:LytR cell envelope-related transcriptional attenuator